MTPKHVHKLDHLTKSWKASTILYHHMNYSSVWEKHSAYPHTGHYADMPPPHL